VARARVLGTPRFYGIFRRFRRVLFFDNWAIILFRYLGKYYIWRWTCVFIIVTCLV